MDPSGLFNAKFHYIHTYIYIYIYLQLNSSRVTSFLEVLLVLICLDTVKLFQVFLANTNNLFTKYFNVI